MDAMGVLSVMFLVGALMIAVIGIWRLNLVLNHLEKHERLQAYEDRVAAKRKETLGRIAKVGFVVGKGLLKRR